MNPFVSGLLRHKSLRPFWQLFSLVTLLPFFFLGYFLPKNQKIWVFGNIFGFKDNARYLFEYVQKCHPEITPVWISCHETDCTSLGYSYSRFSPAGIWFQYRAGVAFVSTGQGDLARFTLAQTKIIQLWHGIPIKHILLNSKESLPFQSWPLIFSALPLKIFKKNLRRYSVVIASSKKVQKCLASAFGLPEEQVQITGYPRHDVIIENSKKVTRRILYAPTWRSDLQNAFTITHAICNPEFVSKIKKLGYELWVSIHPLNKKLEEFFEPVSDIIQFIHDQDVNHVLAHSEILITDYSSIAVDFSLLNRKVVFFTPDMEEYLQERGIYKEFETIILENGVRNSADILEKITVENTACCVSLETFFRYRDTKSRKRIVEMVIKNFLPNSADV